MKITDATPSDFDPDKDPGISSEEEAAYEESFQKYTTLVDLYKSLLNLEDDPARRFWIQVLLQSLEEDNK